MKKTLLLLTASLGILVLSGCTYDEGGSVSVSSGSTGYHGYDDDYIDDGPYYSHSGRRYYSSGGRYRYYEGRRPIYVTQLPRGASYVETRRGADRVVVNNYRSRPSSSYRYQEVDRRSDYRGIDARSDDRRSDYVVAGPNSVQQSNYRTESRRSDIRRVDDDRADDRYVVQSRSPGSNVRVRTDGDQVRVRQRATSAGQAVIVKERKKKRDSDDD